MPHPIPTHVITGAAGAGKTALIARLLSGRPRGEHWGVLQNDPGTGTLDLVDREVTVRRVSGCICCTGQVALRTVLIALVREARPQRILIEASAAARPAAVNSVLHEAGIAPSLDLRSIACVVSARQLADARYLASDVYREQIASADVIVLGDANAAERRAARGVLAEMVTATRILDSSDVDLGALHERRNPGALGHNAHRRLTGRAPG